MPQSSSPPGLAKPLVEGSVTIPQTLEIRKDTYAEFPRATGVIRDPVPVSVLRQVFGPGQPYVFTAGEIPEDILTSFLPGPKIAVSAGLSGKYAGEEKPWVSAPRLVVQSAQLLPPVVPGGTERRILIWDSGTRIIPGFSGVKKGPQFLFTLFRVIPESEALEHLPAKTLEALQQGGYGESVTRYELYRENKQLEAALLFPGVTALANNAGFSATALSSLGIAKTGGVIAGAGKGIARVAPGKPRDC